MESHPECKACPLWEGCKTVGMATTPLQPVCRNAWPSDTAILVLGEAPGFYEDRDGVPFIGPSGHILRTVYIDHFNLPDLADVYLGNAVRCRPPDNETPSALQIKACHQHLLADLQYLAKMYDRVFILACGAPAARSCGFTSLKNGFSNQGRIFKAVLEEPPVVQVPVFSTFHPAYVRRNPSAGMAVELHLQAFVRALKGNTTPAIIASDLHIQQAPPPPTYPISRASLDIETYGKLKGYTQTQFHPRKSEAYDGVLRGKQVVSASISWPDPDGELQHGIFLPQRPKHLEALQAWLSPCIGSATFKRLLGHNFPFDLQYLRYNFPHIVPVLDYPLPIMDTMVTNYLAYEARPERSLKDLSALFNVTKYREDEGSHQFESVDDPLLWQYNCQDTAATLRLQEELEESIRRFYGPDSQKLSPFCYRWYSELLWLVVWMSEAGVSMDVTALKRLDGVNRARLARIHRISKYVDLTLSGKGSQKCLRGIMDDATNAILAVGGTLPKLGLTDKTKKLKYDAENRNALLPLLRRGTPRHNLRLLGAFQSVSKLQTSYLTPLLVGRKKGRNLNPTTRVLDPHLPVSQIYPIWFPVPGVYEGGTEGGTQQARFAGRDPSVPTFPPPIKRLICGRWGTVWWWDYSQIELRVAALLSNDGPMLSEYRGKPDLHTQTARIILAAIGRTPFHIDDMILDAAGNTREGWKTGKWRQAGKKVNFLMLYRGGAYKLRSTLLQELGIELTHVQCHRIIAAFWKAHPELRKWQDKVVDFAATHGYYELPLIGQSRLFLGGRSAMDDNLGELANLPVQAIAADIMFSGQFHVSNQLHLQGLRSLVTANIYDGSPLEIFPGEEEAVRQIMDEILPNPPFFRELCTHLGRSVPLEFEVTVK